MAGDSETGVSDHQAREGARRRADRGPGFVRGRARGRRRRGVRAGRRARGDPARAGARRARCRRSASRRARRPTPTRSPPTTAVSTSSAPRGARRSRPRALSAHRRARRAPRSRRHDLESASRRGRLVRARRGAARRRSSDDVRRMAPRPATVSPARVAAYDVLVRVFEDDAYADRALRTAAAGLDERDRALAQRLAYGAVQRVRTLDHAIETLGRRRVHRLDPPVRAALRLGAYQLGFVDGVATLRGSERVRRARPRRGARARRGVHERRAPPARRRHRPAPRRRSPSRHRLRRR